MTTLSTVAGPAAAGALITDYALLDSKSAAATHYPSPLYEFSPDRTLHSGDDQSEGLNEN